MTSKKTKLDLSAKIIIAMVLAIGMGFIFRAFPESWQANRTLLEVVLNIGGQIFINLMKMIVVPLVFFSLVCGISSLNDSRKIGRIGVKSLSYFLGTTVLAVAFALFAANLSHVGMGINLPIVTNATGTATAPSLEEFFINIFPSNPFQALTNSNMLQIIVFAILLGFAINLSGEHGKKIKELFDDVNEIINQLVKIVLHIVPYGVFCLITLLFAQAGVDLMLALLSYCVLAIVVLIVYAFLLCGFLIKIMAGLNLRMFFNKLRTVMLFAFSTASSNATLPLALKTTENNLGVNRTVAAFTLPLGININKNGSAIVEAIAVIFIANAYHLALGLSGQLMVGLMVVLISIGTAGAPSAGIFLLVVILKQVGLPVDAIALIIGVDRILDMIRTVLNVIGNVAIACVVGKSENVLDEKIYQGTPLRGDLSRWGFQRGESRFSPLAVGANSLRTNIEIPKVQAKPQN